LAFFAAAMSLFFTSLNSGSNGNCYYVGNDRDAVLIDIGLSCRETEKRLKALDLQIKNIKAIFISHEHGDHIKGVSVFANKHNIPVYITPLTAKHGPRLIGHISMPFKADEPVTIGTLTVTAFTKQHDAIDPHSFIVSYNGINVGVFTDIGDNCKQVISYFKLCNACFLEANYDELLLENGKYPLHLKDRIRGGQGHLSNRKALDLFIEHRPSFLTHLILSHLSKENNSPGMVEELFTAHAGGTKIIVASRYQASPVYHISSDTEEVNRVLKPMQLDLFGL
jgi:phosphoribosyl 1,2-cyclic phosphodiesterase